MLDTLTLLLARNYTDNSISEAVSELEEEIGSITEFDTIIVQQLPDVGIKGVFYLVPARDEIGNDCYEEYLYVNNRFERFGVSQPIDAALSDVSTNPVQNKVVSAALQNLDQKIDTSVETREHNAANSMTVSQVKNTGVITFRLYNILDEIIDEKTLDLDTEKIIKTISLDYTNKKLVATCTDNTTIECNISELIDDFTDKINNLDVNQVGANGSYIKFVSQSNGLLAAQAQAFDLVITAQANNNNAPTTKAVKDYVDTSIDTAIDGLDLTAVGENGKYIKIVSQTDGQVSASAESFDTTIPNSNPSNITAPTTKAVKDYVDDIAHDINGTINDLDLQQVGQDGKYIKLISQEDGQVSASVESFDTTILTGEQQVSNITAPTTQAVKTYVDAEESRASEAEEDLQDNIDTLTEQLYKNEQGEPKGDVLQLQDRCSAIENDIEALDLSQVGSSDTKTYVKYVSQADGQLSAQAAEFDSAIPSSNPSEITAPTTKAVKDYVDAVKQVAESNDGRLDVIDTGLAVNNGDVDVLHNMTVEGNLTVKGKTTTTEQESIQSEETLIITNSGNAPLVDYTGIVALTGTYREYEVTALTYLPKTFYYKDGNNYILDESLTYTEGRTYYVAEAIANALYDNSRESVVLGRGIYVNGDFIFDVQYLEVHLTVDSYRPNTYYTLESGVYVLATGSFDPNETYYARVSQGQNLATRADSSRLTDKHLMEWSSSAFTLVDSGKSLADIATDIENAIPIKVFALNGTAQTLSNKTINLTVASGSTQTAAGWGDEITVGTVQGVDLKFLMPANPNVQNTAGATASAEKLFLIGAQTQTASPQTYSNSKAYIQNDCVYSDNSKVLTVSKCTLDGTTLIIDLD